MAAPAMDNRAVRGARAGVDVETRTIHPVISGQQTGDFGRLVRVTATPPVLIDLLQANNVGAAHRFAAAHEVDDAVQATAELYVVTDDFHSRRAPVRPGLKT